MSFVLDRHLAAIVFIAFLFSAMDTTASSRQSAEAVVGDAMNAMGGESELVRLTRLRIETHTITYRLDDSERAEGPFWIEVLSGQELRDYSVGRYRADYEDSSAQWKTRVTEIGDTRVTAVGRLWQKALTWTARPSLGDTLALSPERLLITADQAPDLHFEADAEVFRVPHRVLAFKWKGFPVPR